MATIIYGFSPPTGFDSDEPVRLRIMGVIAIRLAALTVANGYHYEFASVTYGKQLRAEPYPEPQAYFSDPDETVESESYGTEHKAVVVEVQAITILDDPADPTEVAVIEKLTDLDEKDRRQNVVDNLRAVLIARTGNLMLADVQRAMFRDPRLQKIDPYCNDLADGLRYESSTEIFGMRNHLWAGNTSQWVITYHSVRGKPHLLQEEE